MIQVKDNDLIRGRALDGWNSRMSMKITWVSPESRCKSLVLVPNSGVLHVTGSYLINCPT